MSIEIKDLTKHYGRVTALDHVSLSLEENKIYGLLGNNGAGKTTLMSILTGLLYADEGSIEVDGEPLDNNDSALGKFFFLTENKLFPDDMKVKRAFDIAEIFYPEFDRVYAEKLTGKFGLNIKSKIQALSTGYASIFRLILALSVNTPYLLLDEPVLGLDAQHRDMFYRLLLEKYSERPCTIVISTHLIAEAADMIEHAIIINGGRIIKDSSREELTGGVYWVSGPSGLVDEYTADKKILSENKLGNLKTACIEGEQGTPPPGLEFSAVNLQDYFISLMGGGDIK